MSSKGIIARALQFTFVLGTGTFGTTGSNTVTVQGTRASVVVSQPGGVTMATANIKVYGLPPTIINQLSTLGQTVTSTRKNSVAVQAGDKGGSLATVFVGTMFNVYGDYNQQPDTPLTVDASAGFFDAIAPSPPTSFVGPSDVATMLQGIATQMGLAFENNGVTTKLSNAYYAGSAWEQAKQIVHDAGIEWNCGDFPVDSSKSKGVLAIWPSSGFREGTPPLIAAPPEGGMIGYPNFFPLGIQLRTVYNPLVVFGRQIQVKSSLPNASGLWRVSGLEHRLDSEMPGGAWESVIQATPPSIGPAVPSL